jgi:hypothetical protein
MKAERGFHSVFLFRLQALADKKFSNAMIVAGTP